MALPSWLPSHAHVSYQQPVQQSDQQQLCLPLLALPLAAAAAAAAALENLCLVPVVAVDFGSLLSAVAVDSVDAVVAAAPETGLSLLPAAASAAAGDLAGRQLAPAPSAE